RQQPVVHPGAAPLGRDESGLAQQLQMVRDRGLGQVEGGRQVAHAHLAAVLGGDHRQQPQPYRVGQGLERPGELDGFFLVQGRGQQSRTAILDGASGVGRSILLNRHSSIITSFDQRCNLGSTDFDSRPVEVPPCPVFSSPSTSPTSMPRCSSTPRCSASNPPSAAPATPTSPSPSPRSNSSSSKANPARTPAWTTWVWRSRPPDTSMRPPHASRTPDWPPSRRTTPPAATRCRTRCGSTAPARNRGRSTWSRTTATSGGAPRLFPPPGSRPEPMRWPRPVARVKVLRA